MANNSNSPEEKRNRLFNRRIEQLTFPRDLGERFMQLSFAEYSYNFTKNSIPDQKILSSISLPLPENLLQNSAFRVGQTDLGGIGYTAAEALSKFSGVDIENLPNNPNASKTLADRLRDTPAEEIEKFTAGLFQHAGRAIASVLPSGIETGIETSYGYYFNPFQAIAFNGVDMRTYSFNWTLAPTTRKETENLRRIINELHKHSHPKYSVDTSRAFILYPNVCEINLIPDIVKYKPCMISQLQVDYTGGGELAFLEGGNPAVVKISMTVSEMAIWTRDDFEENVREYQ